MFFIRHWDSDVSEGQESWAWENDVKSHSNRYRLKIIFMLPGYLVKCLDIQKSDIFALIRQMRQIVVIYETWTLLIQWRPKSITHIFLLLPKHFLFWSKLWEFLRNPRLLPNLNMWSLKLTGNARFFLKIQPKNFIKIWIENSLNTEFKLRNVAQAFYHIKQPCGETLTKLTFPIATTKPIKSWELFYFSFFGFDSSSFQVWIM